jgi:hypothetical protein
MEPMEVRTIRLSRPLYETLPYLYMAVGLLGLVGAYVLAGKIWSDVALVLSVVCLLGGLVVLLRRRDYREARAQYTGAALDERSLG